MTKTTPWINIKAEYLSGVTPKELALKYGIKARTISDKAYEEKWREEKARISENIRETTQERVERITNLALTRLEDVLIDGEIKANDLVNAIGKALDISGLKRESRNVDINKDPIEVKFI